MKRSKLEHQMKRIGVRTPRWFWTYCWKCGDYYKQEPMFTWTVSGSSLYGGNYRIYNCKHCCPNLAAVVSKNEQYFGKHHTIDKGEQHALEDQKLAAPLDRTVA